MIPHSDRARSHTYYVCYNQVSYVVACENAMRVWPGRSTLLIDSKRIVTQPSYIQALEHRQVGRAQVLAACVRSLVGRVTVFVPHRRFGRLLQVLCRFADSLGLVDDGLDTLRERPKNIELDSLKDFAELLTFEDYESLASWTRAVPVRRVCPLSRLVEDLRPALPVDGARALVVQSPGVDVAKAAAILGVAEGDMLVVVHSNPNKRGDVPEGCLRSCARDGSIEKAVLAFEGPVLVGETMVLVVALYLRGRSELVVALSAEQFANLKCLHERLSAGGVRLVLH